MNERVKLFQENFCLAKAILRHRKAQLGAPQGRGCAAWAGGAAQTKGLSLCPPHCCYQEEGQSRARP